MTQSAECYEVLRALKERRNVLISGPPAAGKSHLLNEVAEAFTGTPVAPAASRTPVLAPSARVPIPARPPAPTADPALQSVLPSLDFPNDPSEERLWLWVAIANSLPFDWMLRRVVTTTINYFLLVSVPLPAVQPDSLPGRQLIEIAKTLQRLDTHSSDSANVLEQIGELRARADFLIATAYGLSAADISLIFEDFPLLDRRQPALPGESQSSVTRDALLRMFERRTTRLPGDIASHAARYEAARQRGAVPYLPSQVGNATGMDDEEMAYRG